MELNEFKVLQKKKKPNLVYSCDPGKHMCAVAVFSDSELEDVRYGEPEDIACTANESLTAGAISVYIEIPQIYQAGKQKGDQNDLIEVAFAAGQVAGIMKLRKAEKIESIYPRDWKGNIDKTIMLQRIEAKLTKIEKEIFEQCASLHARSKRHNLLDAVGIGLHALGRLKARAK